MLNLLPSPQISVQTSFVEDVPPLHCHPNSIPQELLHPSPFDVFPSSQYVGIGLNLLASPQISVQMSLAVDVPPEQLQPTSIAHELLHPSPFRVFESSQEVAEVLNLFPSPQTSLQMSLVVADPPVQENPISTAQELLHPSPFKLFPSSQ